MKAFFRYYNQNHTLNHTLIDRRLAKFNSLLDGLVIMEQIIISFHKIKNEGLEECIGSETRLVYISI